MRELGMSPVLPAFAGHVPPSLVDLYPNSTITKLDPWAGFNDTYSGDYLLDFQDPLFDLIQSLFIDEQMRVFGDNGPDKPHVYNADTFNEMVPVESDTEYLKQTAASLFNSMAKVDEDAIWMIQGERKCILSRYIQVAFRM